MASMEKGMELQLKQKADRYSNIFLLICFMGGVILASYSDTWLIGIGVGGAALVAHYVVKALLPRSSTYQYVLGAVVGLFTVQYIHQMHGMFEMYLFAFIGSTFLIIYHNWRLQIPLALVVLIHHLCGTYWPVSGTDPLYAGELSLSFDGTQGVHLLLGICIFLLCGFWAYMFRRFRQSQLKQSFRLGKHQGASKQGSRLLRMRTDLRASNLLNEEVSSSIRYAQRLQKALLPDPELLAKYFESCFVFDRPHSIIGGDFLWYRQLGREMLVACVDCTGHGVPGAFMTIVATDLLNRIAREQPDQIPGIMLEMIDIELRYSMGFEKKGGVDDGMDISLCRIDLENGTVQFAGAMNSVILASSEGVSYMKGSRHGVGGHRMPGRKEFVTHELKFREGDMLYLFSDGYVHQFGGRMDKKFTRSGLLSLLEGIQAKDIGSQRAAVAQAFDDWKGANQQTDDTIFVGIQLKRANATMRNSIMAA